MTTVQQDSGDVSGSHVKIGTESHPMRMLVIVAAVVIAGGAMGLFYWRSSVGDAPKLQTLADFRSAFAAKCAAKDFEGPTSSYLADVYLRTPTIQAAVVAQAAVLDHASCADMTRDLKLASYPFGATN